MATASFRRIGQAPSNTQLDVKAFPAAAAALFIRVGEGEAR